VRYRRGAARLRVRRRLVFHSMNDILALQVVAVDEERPASPARSVLFVDVATKVVGVASVGTRCYVVLLEGRDQDDPLFLQVKEAEASVLEAHLPKSVYKNQEQRVVAGQRLMQAASDVFLGWLRVPTGRDFY
jgi:uncharacterized protein (DUF2252 family)